MTVAILILLVIAILSQFFIFSGMRIDPGVSKESRTVINIFLIVSLVLTAAAFVMVTL